MVSDSDEFLSKVAELSPEQELSLEKNIVWLFGTRRSGTTWLGKQLLSYNTHYIHEPDITTHLEIAMNPNAEDLVRRIDFRKKIDDYFFAEKYKKTWSHYLGKLILYRIYAQIQDCSKKIIVKEPSSQLDASDVLSEATQNSKKIILLRDGRDVIDSLLDARQKTGWLVKKTENLLPNKQRSSFIKHRAKLWVLQTETLLRAFENTNSDLRILVKYENLRNDTEKELEQIYKFLDIDISKEEIKKLVEKFSFKNIPSSEKGEGKFFRSASPGKWKENFSKNEIETLEGIMSETLQKIGYDG